MSANGLSDSPPGYTTTLQTLHIEVPFRQQRRNLGPTALRIPPFENPAEIVLAAHRDKGVTDSDWIGVHSSVLDRMRTQVSQPSIRSKESFSLASMHLDRPALGADVWRRRAAAGQQVSNLTEDPWVADAPSGDCNPVHTGLGDHALVIERAEQIATPQQHQIA